MARPHWPLALLAASLAGLLLADIVAGQTFTYSRGWKPGGKRSRPPPPAPAPRLRAAALTAGQTAGTSATSGPAGQLRYPEDLGVGPDQGLDERYYLETPVRHGPGERWAPYEMAPWRHQDHQDDGDDAEHAGER